MQRTGLHGTGLHEIGRIERIECRRRRRTTLASTPRVSIDLSKNGKAISSHFFETIMNSVDLISTCKDTYSDFVIIRTVDVDLVYPLKKIQRILDNRGVVLSQEITEDPDQARDELWETVKSIFYENLTNNLLEDWEPHHDLLFDVFQSVMNNFEKLHAIGQKADEGTYFSKKKYPFLKASLVQDPREDLHVLLEQELGEGTTLKVKGSVNIRKQQATAFGANKLMDSRGVIETDEQKIARINREIHIKKILTTCFEDNFSSSKNDFFPFLLPECLVIHQGNKQLEDGTKVLGVGKLMKFAVGSLQDWYKNFYCDTKTLLQIAEDILLALAIMEEAGIVHRDIKFANLLLDWTSQGWRCKTTDFGMSNTLEEIRSSSNTDEVLGTPGFMPRRYLISLELRKEGEQKIQEGIVLSKSGKRQEGMRLLHEGKNLKHQAEEYIQSSKQDMYAAGMVFYHLFSGQAHPALKRCMRRAKEQHKDFLTKAKQDPCPLSELELYNGFKEHQETYVQLTFKIPNEELEEPFLGNCSELCSLIGDLVLSRVDSARECYKRFLQLKPKIPSNPQLMARNPQLKHNVEEAIEQLNKYHDEVYALQKKHSDEAENETKLGVETPQLRSQYKDAMAKMKQATSEYAKLLGF